MKEFFKNIIRSIVKVDWVWRGLSKTLIPFAYYFQVARQEATNNKHKTDIAPTLKSLFSDKTVLNGTFAGMKYPEMEAVGSMLLPKLLGSYESELEGIIKRICDTNYSEIVDVGCAEGYYAIGLAMQLETATVFAFDTDSTAIALCNKMADLNGVAKRVKTDSFCDSNTLKKLPLTQKALVISDCEGYEKQLFSKENIDSLSNHDVLIEVHDFLDLEISGYLIRLFEVSHHIQIISSVDDVKKAQTYSYKELENLSLDARKQIVSEGRPGVMEWMFMTSKRS